MRSQGVTRCHESARKSFTLNVYYLRALEIPAGVFGTLAAAPKAKREAHVAVGYVACLSSTLNRWLAQYRTSHSPIQYS